MMLPDPGFFLKPGIGPSSSLIDSEIRRCLGVKHKITVSSFFFILPFHLDDNKGWLVEQFVGPERSRNGYAPAAKPDPKALNALLLTEKLSLQNAKQ